MLRTWLLSFFLLGCTGAYAVPEKDLWVFWNQSDETSRQVIDHSLWQGFIDRYLKYSQSREMFMVLYGKVSEDDWALLKEYLDMLSRNDPRMLNRQEQLVYWINLYNALTVNLILKHYPVKSITRLGVGWFRIGPWQDKMITVVGKELSLHDIEHRILRPMWDDPKIHYALNCASIGCPDLAPKAYTSDQINYQLKLAGDRFINQKKGVNFVSGRMVLSQIFKWYEDDFHGEQGVRKELFEHAQKELKEKIKAYKGRISYRYDWQLNEYEP